MEEKRSQTPGHTAKEREDEISRGRGSQRPVGATEEGTGKSAERGGVGGRKSSRQVSEEGVESSGSSETTG